MAAAALGNAPLGSTPFGLGTTATAAAPPTRRILAPYIDPLTGQCVVGDDGELESMPVNRQRVMLSCLTRRGSSSVLPQLGTLLPGKITEALENDVRSEVMRSLAPMEDAGDIRVDGIAIEVIGTGRVQITVSYTDTRSRTEDKARFYG